ncbi:hypothetical protein [Nitrospira sp. BLG_2]|uniref:hypothetical protein n=1 Tax=Nitrospira sp. BLG_2 TaxID=3397507 RepID=UPI003B9A4FA7
MPKITTLFTFLLEDGSLLSTGNRIAVAGTDLTYFLAYPVILWSHTGPEKPIGRGVRLWRDEGRLFLTLELAPAALNPAAACVEHLLRSGQVSGCSGQFAARRAIANGHGGVDVQTSQLLEVSLCAEPFHTIPGGQLLNPAIDPTFPAPPKKYAALAMRHQVYDAEGLAQWVGAQPCQLG